MASSEDMYSDPEEHLKKLVKVFGVSKKIQQLALANIGPDQTPEEILRENKLIARAKAMRQERMSSLGPVHTIILEIVAQQLNITLDEVKAGIADSDLNINSLKGVTQKDGLRAVIFSYDLYDHPSKGNLELVIQLVCTYFLEFFITDSGRYVHADRYTKMLRLICSSGYGTEQSGKCIVVYRVQTDRDIDMRNVGAVS